MTAAAIFLYALLLACQITPDLVVSKFAGNTVRAMESELRNGSTIRFEPGTYDFPQPFRWAQSVTIICPISIVGEDGGVTFTSSGSYDTAFFDLVGDCAAVIGGRFIVDEWVPGQRQIRVIGERYSAVNGTSFDVRIPYDPYEGSTSTLGDHNRIFCDSKMVAIEVGSDGIAKVEGNTIVGLSSGIVGVKTVLRHPMADDQRAVVEPKYPNLWFAIALIATLAASLVCADKVWRR